MAEPEKTENEKIIDAVRAVFTPDAESLTPDIEPAVVFQVRDTDDDS